MPHPVLGRCRASFASARAHHTLWSANGSGWIGSWAQCLRIYKEVAGGAGEDEKKETAEGGEGGGGEGGGEGRGQGGGGKKVLIKTSGL